MDAKSRGRLVLALSYAETREWEPVGVCGECGQSLNARWRLQESRSTCGACWRKRKPRRWRTVRER